MDLQSAATLIGLVSGVSALTLSILNYLRDRAALHVVLKADWLVKNSQSVDPNTRHLVVEVTNIGRRPTFVTSACLLFPDGQNAVLSDSLLDRKQLKEGDEPQHFLCEQNMVNELGGQWPGVYCVVRTSAGNQFRSRFIGHKPKGGTEVSWIRKIRLRCFTLIRHRWAIKNRFRE